MEIVFINGSFTLGLILEMFLVGTGKCVLAKDTIPDN